MSYRQDNQYQRPPPVPPRPPYQAQSQQYQQDQYNGQSGVGHPPEQTQQHTYPGQQVYTQYGGPLQHSQQGASTASSTYATGVVTSPQQYGPPHQPYNPQQYSPSLRQSSIPAYNPQNYSPQLSVGQMPAYNPQNYSPQPNAGQSSGQAAYQTYASRASFSPQTYANLPLSYPSEPTTQATSGPLDDTYDSYHYETPSAPPQSVRHRLSGSQIPLPALSPHVSPQPPSHSQAYPPPPRAYPSHAANVSPPPGPGAEEAWRPSPPVYSTGTSLPSPPVASLLMSSPGPTPPLHSSLPLRSSSNRTQSRPLPGLPEDGDTNYFAYGDFRQETLSEEELNRITQEELFNQVQDAVMNAGRDSAYSPAISTPVHTRTGSLYSTGGSRLAHGAQNGRTPSSSAATGAKYSDDSDAEAQAGLDAMYRDEQREREEQERRQSGSTARFSYRDSHQSRRASTTPRPPHASDSDEYGTVDMTAYGGGYDPGMTHAADPNANIRRSAQSSISRSHASQSSNGGQIYTPSFSPFTGRAVVDDGGAGGMYEPTADGRRPSFDEGDEYTFNEGARFPDEPPDFFYQPTSAISHRPLPPPPLSPPMISTAPSRQFDAWPAAIQSGYRGPPPYDPDEYIVDAQGVPVPRSTSLTNHSTTPQINAPSRSKTDAELNLKKPGTRSSTYNSPFDMAPATAGAIALDLPSLAAKRFIASKLGAPDFNKCEEPWAVSAILAWLTEVTTPDQTTELREAAIVDALVGLFTNKVPTMNIADAEALSARVVQEMYAAGALQQTEEWVKLVPSDMSGVIFQLTGTGCYSPTVHDHIIPGRCYSHYCQRTLKKVNLSAQPQASIEAWAEFYKLRKEDVIDRDKKEIERQNVLHEIVQTEDIYMEQLNILLKVYRDPLASADGSIITPNRKDHFIKEVFGRVEAVKQANEDHLLPQLKYRQQEQGPWIIGFSDIFRQWIRKAKKAYLDYAGAFPSATFTVRREMERNIHFAQFLDLARQDRRGARLGWDTYLKAPITRLQRYSLLLQTVLKNMTAESEEKSNLRLAVDEVKSATLECDAAVAEMQRKVDLADLQNKLVLRPGMQNVVELNLNHLGRELVHRGDLQRMGDSRFTWVDSHVLLFDHYLVIAKTVTQRAEQGGQFDKYDVSKLPIPMDLLVLETTNEPPVQKSTYMRGISTVTTVTPRPVYDTPGTLAETNSNQSMPQLQHANTGTSSVSLHTVTTLDSNVKDSERILYPFKIKHLGKEIYSLFAFTEQARRDWCTKIVEAKTKHAAALFAQHAEPFKLRVIADSAFVYELGTQRSVLIRGTPMERALNEVAHRFKDTGRPGPVCRVRVNCATSFTMPYPAQKQMTAIGTDNGVYLSEQDNPRGWTKVISIARVTQLAVLEEFNLFLMIAERQLIAYHLDVVCPIDGHASATSNDSGRRAPQKLSGHKDVGFFVSGKMKDRTLVFYKKRENMASTFKVLEPIYQKSTEKKRGMFKRGNTESFREYDEFYIPAECSGVNLFHSSLSVSTARGFEVLTLDRKHPVSVPDLQPEPVQAIARHLRDKRALCMLRISDPEFLLCYDTCAVYINQHGEVSRSVIMEYIGTAQTVAMFGAYIILFDHDFVEIRNATNGRLKQIIPGKDIRCLDDGGCWTAGNPIANSTSAAQRMVKFVMQHPELEKTQIVVELLLNENMRE